MKFGIFYEHSVSRPWSDISEWRVYHQALEQIRLADKLGFDQVWEVEHHFLDEYSHSPAPEVFLAAAAAQTQNIHICQGIALCLPQVNHPARIAERAAVLDIISNGRLEFGTGRSATWTELGGFQVEPDDTKEQWDEVIRAIPRMWRDEEFEWEGKYFSMPARNVLPKPVQKPHPPMWVAVSSPETAIQAAERGMGLLGVSIGTPDEYEERVADYRRIIKTAEPVGEFVNNQVNGVGWMFCGETEEEAQAVGTPGSIAFMNSAAHLSGVGAVYPSPAYGSQASAIQLRNRPGDVAATRQQQGMIGSPDQVIEALKGWESIGVDRMVFLINYDQVIPHAKIMESLTRFAEEVMPAFHVPGELPSLTTLPDFDAVEEVGLFDREEALVAGGD